MLYMYMHIYIYTYIYIWQWIKNIGLVTATDVCITDGAVLRQTDSATSPLKTAVLYTEVSDKGL